MIKLHGHKHEYKCKNIQHGFPSKNKPVNAHFLNSKNKLQERDKSTHSDQNAITKIPQSIVRR